MSEVSYTSSRVSRLGIYTGMSKTVQLSQLKKEIKDNYNKVRIDVIKKDKNGIKVLLKVIQCNDNDIGRIDSYDITLTLENLKEIIEFYFSF